MRNFLTIAKGIDTLPVLQALQRNSDLWDSNSLRTTYPNTPHIEASDILVFFNDLENIDIVNDKEVIPYPAWDKIPQLRPLVFGLLRQVDGIRLGRVMITRLAPGKSIYPHEDAGAPANYFDRYQIMLQAEASVLFKCGDETLIARTGDAFNFDNTKTHSVQNNSPADRIALIVDIKSA